MECHVINSDVTIVSTADEAPEYHPGVGYLTNIHGTRDPGIRAVALENIHGEPVELIPHHLDLQLADVLPVRVVEEGQLTP